MKHTDRRQIRTIFALSTKSPATEPASSGRQRENCQNITEYRIFALEWLFAVRALFIPMGAGTSGHHGPNLAQCRSPPRFALTHWPEQEQKRTFIYDGKKITYNPCHEAKTAYR